MKIRIVAFTDLGLDTTSSKFSLIDGSLLTEWNYWPQSVTFSWDNVIIVILFFTQVLNESTGTHDSCVRKEIVIICTYDDQNGWLFIKFWCWMLLMIEVYRYCFLVFVWFPWHRTHITLKSMRMTKYVRTKPAVSIIHTSTLLPSLSFGFK